jgi:hypothetical protein
MRRLGFELCVLPATVFGTQWQFVYSGNARVPFWIVRVPKDIIWGHGGLWSDNSVAMLAALFRIEFPLPPEALAALRSSAASSERR